MRKKSLWRAGWAVAAMAVVLAAWHESAVASCENMKPITLPAGEYSFPTDSMGSTTCPKWKYNVNTQQWDPDGSESCPNLFVYAAPFYQPCSAGKQPNPGTCCVDTTIPGQIKYALCNGQEQGGGCAGAHGAAQNINIPSGAKVTCAPNLKHPCGDGTTVPVPTEDDKTPPH